MNGICIGLSNYQLGLYGPFFPQHHQKKKKKKKGKEKKKKKKIKFKKKIKLINKNR